MKKTLNAALRRLEPLAPHGASNTDLMRRELADRGVPFSFLDRPDTLLAKVLTAGLPDPVEEGPGGDAEASIIVTAGPVGDITTYTFVVPEGAGSLEIGSFGEVAR